jgi:polar amino acid transport system substrate-binding protein
MLQLARGLILALTLSMPLHAADVAPHTLQIATSLSQSTLSSQIEQQLQRAYSRLGYQMQVVRLPAGRSLQMTDRGLYDGELFRIDGVQHEFPQLRQVPVQLASIELLAFVRSEQKDMLRDWILMKNVRVGFVRGFRLASQLQYAGHPVPVTTLEQAVGMLVQGKIDVLLEDQQSVQSVLPAKTEQAGISMLPGTLARAGLYHYLHQRHSDLLQPLATVLKKTVAGAKDKRPLPTPVQPALDD